MAQSAKQADYNTHNENVITISNKNEIKLKSKGSSVTMQKMHTHTHMHTVQTDFNRHFNRHKKILFLKVHTNNTIILFVSMRTCMYTCVYSSQTPSTGLRHPSFNHCHI